ncbi:MAG: penicillin-binding transpeptidase domain-containing protein [Thermodesulfobacteriota bacterium]|nr:penicillin-binding transpeptidase domain-containing protein [Thermodesulfobacteriota bacterium]
MRSWPGIRKNGSDWRLFQKSLSNPPARRKALRAGLKLLSFLLVISAVCASFLYAAKGNYRYFQPAPPSPTLPNSEPGRTFHLPINGGLPHFDKIIGGKFTEERESYRLRYTVDPALQNSVNEVFRNYRPPFAVFVAIEPKTGRIIALADFAQENPDYPGVWQRATYPAASVFKLVTAAGALEKGILNYDSAVSFRGNLYRLGPQKLSESSHKDRRTNFDDALGKSNNVVFGRVASKLLGPQTLRQYTEAFGFNQPFQFDFPLDMSRAFIPEEAYELARCGAGFGEVTLNPLHAAMIAGCIANQGVMMRPYLIEEVDNKNGQKLYQAKTEILAKPITPKTAEDLSRMMMRTVEDGTASKIFQRYGKTLLKKMTICGKTGSLSGDNPPGLYDWFVGFAPAENPQIAFAAMVINNGRWKIKGAFVAQEALKEFFLVKIN